jgi:hypothetical protein
LTPDRYKRMGCRSFQCCLPRVKTRHTQMGCVFKSRGYILDRSFENVPDYILDKGIENTAWEFGQFFSRDM